MVASTGRGYLDLLRNKIFHNVYIEYLTNKKGVKKEKEKKPLIIFRLQTRVQLKNITQTNILPDH